MFALSLCTAFGQNYYPSEPYVNFNQIANPGFPTDLINTGFTIVVALFGFSVLMQVRTGFNLGFSRVRH